MKKTKVIIFILTLGIALATMSVFFSGPVIVAPPDNMKVELTRGHGLPLAYDIDFQFCIGLGCPTESVFNYYIFVADILIWAGLIFLVVYLMARKKQKSIEETFPVSGKFVMVAMILALVTVVLTEFLYQQYHTMYFPMSRDVTISIPKPCPAEGSYFGEGWSDPDSFGCGSTNQISYFNAILDVIVYVVVWYYVLIFTGKIINRISGVSKTK